MRTFVITANTLDSAIPLGEYLIRIDMFGGSNSIAWRRSKHDTWSKPVYFQEEILDED